MENQLIEVIPEKYKTGTMSAKEAVNTICCFVIKNYPLFGLHKFDEDFRSEVFISLLEKGEHVLRNYDREIGCFRKYLYYYIMSLINSRLKSQAKHYIKDCIYFEETLQTVAEKSERYEKLSYSNTKMEKVPYAPKVTPQQTLEALNKLRSSSTDKTLLVLAIKASYYITDSQIERVCRIYKLDKEIMYEIVNRCKNSITKKVERRAAVEERRNKAYYHHKRCSRLVDKLKEEEITPINQQLIENYILKELKYRKRWNDLNNFFEKGNMNLRPTNKTVADILGICERQVTYYINCAKRNAELIESLYAEKEG